MINITTMNTANNTITMSSREIADLTGKEHKNVKRDVEVMLTELELDTLRFEHIYLDSMNREQTEYLLDKELTTCLVSGYNIQLRMAIIKRWTELEQLTVPKLPNFLDPAEAAIAWATEYKAKQEAETKLLAATQTIAIQAPKAEVYDILANKDTTYTIRDAAKLLTVRPIDLTTWLLTSGWMYGSSSSTYRPRASHADLHLVLKVNVHGTQTRVTSKGLMLLAKRMNKELQLNNM